MSFKKYFQKLTPFQKTEVYILIVMFYTLLLYFSNDIYNKIYTKPTPHIAPQILEYQNKLKLINSKITTQNKISIINIIEKNHKQNHIFTESIDIQESKIYLKFNGKFMDIIDTLKFYQLHFVILYYKLQKIDNKIVCEVQLDIKNIFHKDKTLNKIKKLSNPFKSRKLIKTDKKRVKTKSLKIMAIIANNVLIQNKWYIKGDFIGNLKIINISSNSVKLYDIDKKTIKILKVYNE